jgi:hypothetical protein
LEYLAPIESHTGGRESSQYSNLTQVGHSITLFISISDLKTISHFAPTSEVGFQGPGCWML